MTKKKKGKSSAELIEVVDRSNRPLALMPIQEVHRQGLFHRSVLVLIHDLHNRLLLQQRSRGKTLYPGRLDLSAAGHVKAGESCLGAGIRIIDQDLGIRQRNLKHVVTIQGDSETSFEFITLYRAGRINSIPLPDSREIEDLVYVDQDEMNALAQQFPELLTPGLVYFWEKNLLFPPK
ncbi:MAG: NUDIX hydrolase [Desulfonatronovibrionaceae bacterium]